MIDHILHIAVSHRNQYDTRIFHKQCKSLIPYARKISLIVQSSQANHSKEGIDVIAVGQFDSPIERDVLGGWRAFKHAWNSGADIIQFHDHAFLFFAILLRIRYRKIIYDAHEDTLDLIRNRKAQSTWKKWISLAIYRILEPIGVKLSTHVFCATDHIKSKLSRYKSSDSITTLNNYPLLSEAPDISARNPLPDHFCYVGGIQEVKGILKLIPAIEKLGATLELAGNFANPALESKARSLSGWKNVEYHGHVGRKEAYEIMNRCIAGFLVYESGPHYIHSQPVKMFEYMNAGLAVISSNFPKYQAFVEEFDCGICIDPDSTKQLEEAIGQLMTNDQDAIRMGLNGRKATESNINWATEEKKLIAVYTRELTRAINRLG